MLKHVEKYYEWVLFLPAVLPLFYIEGTMYPLLAPKILALRALGVVALALFSYLVLSGRSFYWNRLRRRETWIPAALLALAYISSLFGVDFYHSFWSTYERGDGLLTLTVCIGYFYLFLLSAKTEWFFRLFKLVAWVGSIAAAYLVLQWLVVTGIVTLSFIAAPNGRLGGTMGNAAFMAAYLGMTFFAALGAAPEYCDWRRRALYIGAGLQLFAILLTATRGTQLALLAFGGMTLLYLAIKKTGRVRQYARSALGALVVLTSLFFMFRASLIEAPFEPIRRIASISLSDPTTASRLFLWSSISRETLDRPLLGYGAEHVDVPFDRVYDPSIIAEEWFDRAHNVYLDYFVQFGIGGLLLFLALFGVFARASWRLFQTGNRYAPYLLGIVAVYGMQNFFVFDTAMTLWLLCVFIAVTLVYQREEKKEAYFSLMTPRPWVDIGVAFVLMSLVIPVAIQPFRANLLSFEAYQYQIVDLARAKAATDRALALNTFADLELGYNAYFMYTQEQVNRLSGEDLKVAYENTVALLSHNFSRYAYDARTAVYFAQVLSLAPSGVPIDHTFLSAALERAIRLSPKRSQPWYILANLSLSNANEYPAKSAERAAGYAAARDLLNRYIATVPKLSMPHYVLAQLLLASGDAAGARAEAAKGKEYYKENLETALRAVQYYENVLDLPNAAFFLEEILRIDPTNENAKADLETIRLHEK